MKQTLFFTITLSIYITAYAQPTYRIDFSGVDAFFNATVQLKQDKNLTDEQWEAYIQTGGYPYLNFDLQRSMKIAFLPSEQKQRDSLLSLTNFDFAAHTVNHLLEINRPASVRHSYLSATD